MSHRQSRLDGSPAHRIMWLNFADMHQKQEPDPPKKERQSVVSYEIVFSRFKND